MGDKKRLFLAANLGVTVTRKIGDAAARMRQTAERRGLRVSWVPAANLHVTLKFLGWTSAEAVQGIRDRAREVAEARKAFEVTARGAGAYPDEGHARILWVGVNDPGGGLAAIAAGLDAGMARLGFERETRPFSAHVTVGRVKEGRGAEDVLAPYRQTDFGASIIREIVLYESTMKSSGSEYTALARMELGGPGRVTERQTREVEGDNESEAPHGGHESA
jgi:2'-5' RNA ligase